MMSHTMMLPKQWENVGLTTQQVPYKVGYIIKIKLKTN